MFDKLPAFDPPDNNSAGAIALRAWVRGVTARGPPALAFLRKYEEESSAEHTPATATLRHEGAASTEKSLLEQPLVVAVRRRRRATRSPYALPEQQVPPPTQVDLQGAPSSARFMPRRSR